MRWYEDDPAPSKRAALARTARSWREHACVGRDWQLAGEPGSCPVPPTIMLAPKLGLWLQAFVERRRPSLAWRQAMLESHERLLESLPQP